MTLASLCPILLLLCALGTATPLGALADPYPLAVYALHPAATSWFDAGAGQSNDGRLYDNKLAQTFVPTKSGVLASISLAAYRISGTTAPLRIRIADTLDGVPRSTLAVAYIAASDVPETMSGRPTTNITCKFAVDAPLLEAGVQYAFVLDSSTSPANYRLSGCYQFPYADGMRFTSQNTPVWTKIAQGDLFFVIMATAPQPRMQSFHTATDGPITLAWTNNVGVTWVLRSTNLVDWTSVAGPLTNAFLWTGAAEDAGTAFFRIRQTQ